MEGGENRTCDTVKVLVCWAQSKMLTDHLPKLSRMTPMWLATVLALWGNNVVVPEAKAENLHCFRTRCAIPHSILGKTLKESVDILAIICKYDVDHFVVSCFYEHLTHCQNREIDS